MTTSSTPDKSPLPRTRRQVLRSTFFAFLLGLFVVVGVILPAEFSLDPMGTGRILGVLGLAEDGSGVVVLETTVHKTDRVRFELAPFESVEYSYAMDVGGVLIYSWRADNELVFNLHSTPNLPGGNQGPAESFSNGRADSEQGTYTAPFTGRHGWFWENRTDQTVLLELATSGFIGESLRSAVGDQQIGVPRPAL